MTSSPAPLPRLDAHLGAAAHTPARAEPVTASQPVSPQSRIAELQLRSSAGPLPTRVHWPTPSADPRHPGLLVFFPEVDPATGDARSADRLCQELCTGVGLVVLSVGYRTADASGDAADAPGAAPGTGEDISGTAFDDATTATHWAADHAAELHADPGRLLVGGEGYGAALAVAVARHAREQGWPPIALQVLVSPEQAAAPATLVERLRRSLEVAGDD